MSRPRILYTLSLDVFPHLIALSSAIIVATAPSIFSVDFSLSVLMFPAGSVQMNMLSILINPVIFSNTYLNAHLHISQTAFP